MRRGLAIAVCTGMLLYLVGLASCGDFDPAKAPVGAIVTILNGDETITLSCVEDPLGRSEPECTAGGEKDWRRVHVLVSDGNARTGGTSEVIGAPLNGVEVELLTWPIGVDELYLPEDDWNKLPPLAQPYFTETDERGMVEINWRFLLQTTCGTDVTHWIEASVGTAVARYTVSITCEAAETDDDTGDDTGGV